MSSMQLMIFAALMGVLFGGIIVIVNYLTSPKRGDLRGTVSGRARCFFSSHVPGEAYIVGDFLAASFCKTCGVLLINEVEVESEPEEDEPWDEPWENIGMPGAERKDANE